MTKLNLYSPYYDHDENKAIMSIDENGSWVHVTRVNELIKERDEVERLKAEIERLKKAAEETEHSMHLRVRAGYDKAIADSWRAKVADVERERDEARADAVDAGEVATPSVTDAEG